MWKTDNMCSIPGTPHKSERKEPTIQSGTLTCHTHILPHTHIPPTMVIFKTHQIASSSTLNKIPVPPRSCMILHNWASASFFSLNCLSPFFTLCKLWSTLISFGFGDAQSFCLCSLLAQPELFQLLFLKLCSFPCFLVLPALVMVPKPTQAVYDLVCLDSSPLFPVFL